MKKIFIYLIFCFIASKTVAQNSATIQVTETVPNWSVLLTNLNTSQITSGVLIDKITPFSNIINWNTTESNIFDNEHFAQILSELYRASDQTKFISLAELKNRTATTNDDSAEKLVIVGPSMGGQISRYALAYMEMKFAETNLQEWKHNTRLWISVDSPHLGANIPVGWTS